MERIAKGLGFLPWAKNKLSPPNVEVQHEQRRQRRPDAKGLVLWTVA